MVIFVPNEIIFLLETTKVWLVSKVQFNHALAQYQFAANVKGL